MVTLIARFIGPTWGPSGAGRTQMGPMLAPWTLLSGELLRSLMRPQWTKIEGLISILSLRKQLPTNKQISNWMLNTLPKLSCLQDDDICTSCHCPMGSGDLIDQSHRCGRAACREPAGSYDKTTRAAICFLTLSFNPCCIYPHCGMWAHQ